MVVSVQQYTDKQNSINVFESPCLPDVIIFCQPQKLFQRYQMINLANSARPCCSKDRCGIVTRTKLPLVIKKNFNIPGHKL